MDFSQWVGMGMILVLAGIGMRSLFTKQIGMAGGDEVPAHRDQLNSRLHVKLAKHP